MRRIRRSKTRRSLRRKPINVLASAVTCFSLYLGLASIFRSIRGDYEWAAYFIFCAMVCDMFDGTLAKLTRSVSEFGKELDSLCDLVSFGVAPAVLIYHAYLYEEQLEGSAVGRTGSVMAIIFVICAALRLARYNVYQSQQRDIFTGLPVPAAGAAVASFVLFMDYFGLHVAFYVLGPLTMALAYLMVSTVRYPKDRIKKMLVVAPHSGFRMLAVSVVVIAVFHYAFARSPAILLFPMAMTYVLFGIGDELSVRLRLRKVTPQPAPLQPAAPGDGPPSASPPPA